MSTPRAFPPHRARAAVGFACLLLLAACAPSARIKGGGGNLGTAKLEPYDGPKARIAVAKFEDKTKKGAGRIGDAMATMTTTALVGTNRFIVLERDVLDEVIREQDLGAAGRVKAGTEAPVGEIEGAELLAIGAVTEFEPEKMGVGGGIIGLGTLIGSAVLNAQNKNFPIAAATYTESHVAIDLRVVDAVTSRVLFTTSVEAKGQDWGGGLLTGIGGGRSRLPLAFGGMQKTATEQAVRRAIDLGVADLARRTPPEYFRHRPDEFASGRMLAFAYVDIEGTTGERVAAPGFRVAASKEEWGILAAELGLAGKAAAPPVDFARQRVAAIFAGRQPQPGAAVSVEKAVGFPDRVELAAALIPPPKELPKDAPKIEATPALLHPVALVRIETGAPVAVAWK